MHQKDEKKQMKEEKFYKGDLIIQIVYHNKTITPTFNKILTLKTFDFLLKHFKSTIKSLNEISFKDTYQNVYE